MDKELVKEKIGREPTDDDMDRINCTMVGSVGHFQCGWCKKCDGPRFECGHVVFKETEGKVEREKDEQKLGWR